MTFVYQLPTLLIGGKVDTVFIQSFNQKGGVAKTTTAVNLAAGIKLLRPKASVLLIEADPQGSIKTYFRFKHSDTEVSFANFLIDDTEITPEKMHKAPVGDGQEFDVLCASKRLGDADFKMSAYPRREETLRMRFKNVKHWDYVIFDCAPALNIVTQNILTLANYLIIPSTMDPFSASAIRNMTEQVEVVKKYYDSSPKILGVLPTIFDKRTAISNGALKAVKDAFSSLNIFEPIGVDNYIKKSQIKMKPIYHFMEESRSAKQYLEFCKQTLEIIDKDVAAKATSKKSREALSEANA
jgi:chromosome partitioning protein